MLAFMKTGGSRFAGLMLAVLLFAALCLGLLFWPWSRTAGGLRARSSATQPLTREPVELAKSLSFDSDLDGIPDLVELNSFSDRENFRRWFTFIAEMQFYEMSNAWNVEQRDCAGLVRFAWREALRRHDRAWLARMGGSYTPVAPDVKAYDLDHGPFGEKLFRVDSATYEPIDLKQGKFSEFADARTLKSFNVEFITRDRDHAEPGDLLFFYQPWVQKFPYHVMIFLGGQQVGEPDGTDWVVYHTGPSTSDDGVVKKVRLSVLDHHPNKRWRPVETNPNFLGFYRLKILNQR